MSISGRTSVVVLMIVSAHAAWAATPAAKCEAAKLKIAGKYSLCRLQAQAKTVKLGLGAETSGDFAKCDTTFAKKWDVADTKGGSSCPTSGDAGRVQSVVTELTMLAGFTLAGARFVNNGDGTITDTQTGLMWEMKDGGTGTADGVGDGIANYGDPHDVDNVYTWSASDNARDGTVFTDFLGQLDNCVSDGTTMVGGFGGHCDWRLPNLFELIQILNIGAGICGGGSGACLDPALLPAWVGAHWTSTTDTENLNNVWIARFLFPLTDLGYNIYVEPKTILAHVRAVRGGV